MTMQDDFLDKLRKEAAEREGVSTEQHNKSIELIQEFNKLYNEWVRAYNSARNAPAYNDNKQVAAAKKAAQNLTRFGNANLPGLSNAGISSKSWQYKDSKGRNRDIYYRENDIGYDSYEKPQGNAVKEIESSYNNWKDNQKLIQEEGEIKTEKMETIDKFRLSEKYRRADEAGRARMLENHPAFKKLKEDQAFKEAEERLEDRVKTGIDPEDKEEMIGKVDKSIQGQSRQVAQRINRIASKQGILGVEKSGLMVDVNKKSAKQGHSFNLATQSTQFNKREEAEKKLYDMQLKGEESDIMTSRKSLETIMKLDTADQARRISTVNTITGLPTSGRPGGWNSYDMLEQMTKDREDYQYVPEKGKGTVSFNEGDVSHPKYPKMYTLTRKDKKKEEEDETIVRGIYY